MFDLVQLVDLGSADRERIKMCSRERLAGVLTPIAQLDRWSEKEQTQAEVETFILNDKARVAQEA